MLLGPPAERRHPSRAASATKHAGFRGAYFDISRCSLSRNNAQAAPRKSDLIIGPAPGWS
jgi:copper oxidase (laccase) domain-containing protein